MSAARSEVALAARSALSRLFRAPADVEAQGAVRAVAGPLAAAAVEDVAGVLAVVPPAEVQSVHGVRVAALAAAVGARLGLSAESCAALAFGGLVHDLGKVLLPDELADLTRRAPPSSAAEQALYAQHPELAVGLLIGHAPIDALTREAVVAHHERVDGRGSPYGLAGEAVPLGGRVVAVVDAYDVLMRRPAPGGKRAPSGALATLEGALAAGFDPAALGALAALVEGEGVDRRAPLDSGGA